MGSPSPRLPSPQVLCPRSWEQSSGSPSPSPAPSGVSPPLPLASPSSAAPSRSPPSPLPLPFSPPLFFPSPLLRPFPNPPPPSRPPYTTPFSPLPASSPPSLSPSSPLPPPPSLPPPPPPPPFHSLPPPPPPLPPASLGAAAARGPLADQLAEVAGGAVVKRGRPRRGGGSGDCISARPGFLAAIAPPATLWSRTPLQISGPSLNPPGAQPRGEKGGLRVPKRGPRSQICTWRGRTLPSWEKTPEGDCRVCDVQPRSALHLPATSVI